MALLIPYNPDLKIFARENRKKGVLSEVVFWQHVRNRSFNGLNFDRQRIIGNYIVDFCCKDTGVVIEIDGESHGIKADEDKIRDKYLNNLGLEVIRIRDVEILRNMGDVATGLSMHPLLQKPIPERFCVFVVDRSCKR